MKMRFITNGYLRAVLCSSALLVCGVQSALADGDVPNPKSVEAPAPLDCAVIEAVLAAPENYVIIDARSPSEYDTAHVAGAINVPFDSLDGYKGLLPEDKQQPIVTYCRSGRRATVLKNLLTEMGYADISVVPGGQMDSSGKALSFKCGD